MVNKITISWFPKELHPNVIVHHHIKAKHFKVYNIVYDKRAVEPKDNGLLELNPYGKSDPCLFNAYKAGEQHNAYAELDAMDGSEVAFRYNAVDKVSE